MIEISMSDFSEAFLDDAKTMTRRNYYKDYADKFKPGVRMAVYNRLKRLGGSIIGFARIEDAYYQSLLEMTQQDYISEGFQWMEENNKKVWGEAPKVAFSRWKNSDGLVLVIKFRRE